ncbi:MAG: N-acetylmuramoyl-L-alanine amidase [bacterium]|nr:N-acetylmuramoyl-L-alanine amidase [bacterium]
MSKKTTHIVIGIFILLIAVECVFLIKSFTKTDDTLTEVRAGTISIGESLTLKDTDSISQLPSYTITSDSSAEDRLFIIAEDLPKHNNRFEIVNNGTVLNYDENRLNTIVPENAENTDIPNDAPVYSGSFSLSGKDVPCYTTYDIHLIAVSDLLERFNGKLSIFSSSDASAAAAASPAPQQTPAAGGTTSGSAASIQSEKSELQTKRQLQNKESEKIIIVLDPGHGKSSGSMTDAEKTASGFVKTSKGWGEWRHWKTGTSNVSCEGSGCSGRHPSNGGCWYPIGNGDRDKEPAINLNNALSAKKYLNEMGYEVRMTRSTNEENPSFTKRLSYCYPNNDSNQAADAALCVVIHSNAGGGSGSAYIHAGGIYDQKMKDDTGDSFAEKSNAAGKMINDRITSETNLSTNGSGVINGEEWLIAFCKSPVPVAYLEIGFFDNSKDLAILNSESEKIGQAIAEGIDDYIKSLWKH